MSFNIALLTHMRAIRDCLPRFDARAEFFFGDFRVQIRARGKYYDLLPQYAVQKDGKMTYTPMLTADVTGFIGWRHYFNRQWELSNDKLAFKSYCEARELRVPKLYSDAKDVTAGVIVKKRRSSFGEGIRGPFLPGAVAAGAVTPQEGEYFEQFVLGDIAKIWYWNERPVCLERRLMPKIRGDGKQTARQLVSALSSPVFPVDWTVTDAMLQFQSVSPDSVLPEGQTVVVDFRYVSSLHAVDMTNQNTLSAVRGTSVAEQLERAGPIFWEGIPESIRPNTLYTIDTIIDSDKRVWFLEMNSNPVVHPDCYLAMFEGLFGAPNPVKVTTTSLPPQSNLAWV